MTTPIWDAFPKPLIMSVPTARLLASVPHLVPTLLVEAAEAVLQHSVEQAGPELPQQPGGPGSDVAAEGVPADADLAERLRDELRWRWSRGRRRPGWDSDVEDLPALGPQQWAVVAATAPTWLGSLGDLWMVAGKAHPEEPPLDVAPWVCWWRRRRWARQSVLTRGDAEHVERCVALNVGTPGYDPAAERAQAADLRVQANCHGLAALLYSDGSLARYEEMVEDGLPPWEAVRLLAGEE